VTAIAHSHSAETVACITVRIGPLAGVEPKLLQSAFDISRIGTVAEQAELLLEEQPIRVACNVCMLESDATTDNLTCRHCGAWNTRMVSGDELILARVELEGAA
jgi:hydrogenase nickel incorporation protein HypA/HybF